MKTFVLSSLLIMLLVPTACGKTAEFSVQERMVEADDVTLYVRIAGNPESGNVLIVVHGGPGLSSSYMLSLEQLASQEFAVVTYDQRGAGHSSHPSEGYALLTYVADLEAVRKAVGAKRIHLIGHSWGGLVSMRYATVHPETVKSIILMGSGPPSWEAVLDGQASKTGRILQLQQRGIIPDRPSALAEILPVYFSDPSFELPSELRNLDYDGTVEQLTWSAVQEYDITTEIAKLEHRVLMLWGEDDPFGLQMAQATKNALSAAQVEFVVLKQCGHFWQECADEFFCRVRAFLKQPPASRAETTR